MSITNTDLCECQQKTSHYRYRFFLESQLISITDTDLGPETNSFCDPFVCFLVTFLEFSVTFWRIFLACGHFLATLFLLLVALLPTPFCSIVTYDCRAVSDCDCDCFVYSWWVRQNVFWGGQPTFRWRILISNFTALFLQGSPKFKFTSKIHVQN